MDTSPLQPPARAQVPSLVGVLMLGVFIAFSFVASLPGIWFMPGEWYASLNKPSWNPPNWVFGPVWTTLYLLIGVAGWLVWRRGGFSARRRELTPFLIQWLLNAAWTPLFFGLQRPDLALIEIVLLLGAIVWTIVAFARVSLLAALLLGPYVLWVGFASVLNFTLWRLNS